MRHAKRHRAPTALPQPPRRSALSSTLSTVTTTTTTTTSAAIVVAAATAAAAVVSQLPSVLVCPASSATMQRALPRTRCRAAPAQGLRRRILQKMSYAGHMEYPCAPITRAANRLTVPCIRPPVRHILLAHEARGRQRRIPDTGRTPSRRRRRRTATARCSLQLTTIVIIGQIPSGMQLLYGLLEMQLLRCRPTPTAWQRYRNPEPRKGLRGVRERSGVAISRRWRSYRWSAPAPASSDATYTRGARPTPSSSGSASTASVELRS